MQQNFLDINLNEDNRETLSDRLLRASANATHALLTIASLDDAVNAAIKIIGEALDTDRVTVIEHFNCPEQSLPCWKILYEWDSPDTISQIAHLEGSQGTYEGIESWYESINQGQSITYLTEEMPEPFRSGQEKLGVKALHVVPIFVENKCWGVVGFDDCHEVKHRGQSELSVLKIVANSLGCAIERDRTQKALLQSEQARITELTKANAELIQRDRLFETTTVVANTLLTVAPFEAAIETALKIIGEALDADRIGVIENFDHPLDSSFPFWRTLEYEWYSSNTVSQFSDPDSTQGSYGDIPSLLELFAQGKSSSYVIEDMPEPFRSKQIAIGVKSTHIVPIFVEGKWWGILGLDDCREVKHRSAVELSLLKIAANCIGSAIQRDRSQKAQLRSEQERADELERINTELKHTLNSLKVTEERFRTLFESSSEGFYFTEVDPPVSTTLSIDEQCEQLYHNIRVVEANPAFAAMYGIANPDDCIGIKNSDVHIPDSDKNAAFIRGIVENRRDLETEEIDSQGQSRYFLNGGGFTSKDSYIVAGWGSQVDITQLRQTQQALLINEKQRTAELEKANKTLSRSLSWLAREEDLNKFLEQILLDISKALQAARGHLFVLHQPNRMLEVVARVKEGVIIQDLDPTEPAIFNAPFSADITPLFPMMEEQNLFMIVDMTQLPDSLIDVAWPDSLEWHRQGGYKACASLVLKTGDRSVGFLGLTFVEKQEIIEEKRQLVLALANQAALAILLMQLAEQSKQAAIAHEQEQAASARVVQLVKANAVLKQTLDVLAMEPEIESSLGHVLKVSSEQLDSPSSALWLYNSSTEKFYLHLVYMDNQIIPVTTKNIDLLIGKWLRGRNMDKDLFLKKHIRERSPVIYQVDDASVVPTPLRKSLESMGVKTLLGIPLLLGAEIIGCFTLRFTEKRQFQAEELELTQALANQATLAIQLLRMAEESKQAAIYAERNRLAGEIHDTLAQSFTGISLQLGVAKWLLQEGSLAIEPILDRINDIAQTGLAEARRSVWEIYPTAQEYSNLAEKLSLAVGKLTRACPIQVDLQILGSEYQVSAIIGYNLIKLSQEAITNALKHAKATKLSIILTYKDAQVSLSITDDGCGFQPNPDNGGFGLLSISERSDRLGGQLSINSILGQGTEILVEIPLEAQNHD
jgi:signal transduction histidine kinase/PAS domain-containing protein